MRDPIRFDFSQTKVYTCVLKIPSKGVFTLPNMPSYGRIFRGTVRAFTLPEVNCLLELAPQLTLPDGWVNWVEVLLNCLYNRDNAAISTWAVLTWETVWSCQAATKLAWQSKKAYSRTNPIIWFSWLKIPQDSPLVYEQYEAHRWPYTTQNFCAPKSNTNTTVHQRQYQFTLHQNNRTPKNTMTSTFILNPIVEIVLSAKLRFT